MVDRTDGRQARRPCHMILRPVAMSTPGPSWRLPSLIDARQSTCLPDDSQPYTQGRRYGRLVHSTSPTGRRFPPGPRGGRNFAVDVNRAAGGRPFSGAGTKLLSRLVMDDGRGLH